MGKTHVLSCCSWAVCGNPRRLFWYFGVIYELFDGLGDLRFFGIEL